MNTVIIPWTVLRAKYRNELTKQHARHEQQQQTTSRHIEQAKDALERMLDDASASRRRLPTDGFADTQVSHSPHDIGLLLR